MKKYVNLFVFVFMIGACLSQGRAQTKSAVSYKNPVVDIAMPDPTVIKAADGYFYVYATESTRNVPIMKSKDLVNAVLQYVHSTKSFDFMIERIKITVE